MGIKLEERCIAQSSHGRFAASITRCTRKKGHKGKHKDYYGDEWEQIKMEGCSSGKRPVC